MLTKKTCFVIICCFFSFIQTTKAPLPQFFWNPNKNKGQSRLRRSCQKVRLRLNPFLNIFNIPEEIKLHLQMHLLNWVRHSNLQCVEMNSKTLYHNHNNLENCNHLKCRGSAASPSPVPPLSALTVFCLTVPLYLACVHNLQCCSLLCRWMAAGHCKATPGRQNWRGRVWW